MGPGSNPFGFDLSELLRMLQSQGPVNLDVARQVASVVAAGGPEGGEPHPEPPVDAAAAADWDGLVRAAQSAVAERTGIAGALTVPSSCVTRQEWALGTLDGLAPVLESLAGALGPAGGAAGDPLAAAPESGAEDAFASMFLGTLMPVLLGVWSGWMIGSLGHHALGQYELPLPLTGPPRLAFVARNVDEFAAEWSLPPDELRYALALRETVHGAQRTVPWVRERLVELAVDYVGAYELRADALEEHLGSLDLTDPAAMQAFGDPSALGALGDPSELLGAMRSDGQVPLLEALQRFVSVVEGYADLVVEELGTRMVPAHARIDEAIRRHRLERGDAAAFVDRLLGLELDREHYDQGLAFCRGVVERAGADGLNRLWESAAMFPTRAELEAPGLWLARIDLAP